MDCGLFALLVQRYHDGELDPAEGAEYEQHRRACGPCREIDARFAGVLSALGAMPIHEPSPEFDRRVLSRIDIAAYRVGPVNRLFGALERAWNALPIPLQRCTLVAAVGAAIIAVYKPLLDYMIRTIGLGAGGIWAGMIFMRDLMGGAVGVWKASGTARNYEVVGETLLRTLHRATAGIQPAQVAAIGILVIVAAAVLFRLLGAARRKGETNVGVV